MSAPRRARLAVLAAVVTVVATGGAFLAFRPDAGAGPRLRHQPVAADAGRDGGALAEAGSVATAGASASAGGTATATAAASSSAAASGGSAVSGASSSSSSNGAAGAADGGPSGRLAPAPTARSVPAVPGSGGATTPATAKPAAPVPAGWHLLPAAPIAGRVGHQAVWTGREMVIWGGAPDVDSDPLTDGAAYDPAAGTWRKVPAAPLSARFDATALWTGSEMIVFGGTSTAGDILADGAAWNPATNRWRALPASPLGPRDGAVVAWAGDRLVVWGGATVPPPDNPDAVSQMMADGAAFVPATNGWVAVPAAPIAARSGAEAVWAGTRLLVTGGYHEGDDHDRTDGAALDPISGAWSPIADRPAPGSCGDGVTCTGLWTGNLALFPASGLAYDPAAGRWSAVAPYPSADASLVADPAVWTGTRLLAWGSPEDASADSGAGSADSGATATDDTGAGDSGGADPAAATPLAPPVGGLYDPASGRWQPLPGGPLAARVMHSDVWTGQEFLVWGGTAADTGLADGASYRP